ncbi:MAG: ATP-dependent helicase, partial [Thermodesulfobacteriota bacterium]
MTSGLNNDASRREGLNDEQIKAVEHCDGPLLVIAGAGTGKTSVVARRIAALIENGVPPSRILALTFTEKAANEMEERVDRLVPYGYSAVWISTFHSFGDRVIRDNAIAIGLTPDFKVLSVAECVIFLKEHLFELPLDYYRPSGNPAKYLSELVRFIGRLKDEDVSPEDYVLFTKGLEKSGVSEDYVKQQSELAHSYAKYNEMMAKHGYIDYGDQISLTLKLFRGRPAILERYKEKFSYILADEFQDTNYAQFEIIKLLAGARRNVTVVADDDQSIYKFRGAAISNVLNFKDVYPDAKEITLTTNYRSVQPVLDAAYRLIRHNDPDRLEVKSGINKKLVSIRNNAPSISGVRSLHLDTLTSEVDSVCKIIEDGVKSGLRRLRDFAILVRANSDALPFLRELTIRGMAHDFSGSSGLYSRDEIRLLICFLRAITDHSDNLSLFHVAGDAPYSLKAEDLVPCHNLAKRRHGSLLNVLKDVSFGAHVPLDISAEGLAGIKRLYNDVARWSEMSLKEPTAKVLYSFLTESGYMSGLSSDSTDESEEKVRNIARFFNIVTHIEDTLSVRKPHAFVDYLNLLIEAGDDPPSAPADFESDCVHVLTVHKSKGLEFPVVFMAGLVGGRFPRSNRPELIEIPKELIKDILPQGDFHLEEERRLFYVGMTRAKDELYLTGAADYGGARGKKMSQFVIEALDVPRAAPLKTKPMEAIRKYARAEAPAGKTEP